MNEAECLRELAKAVCSSSFAQGYINAVSQCGSQGSAAAIDIEEECRQSSAGEYCLTVDIDLIISGCRSNSDDCSAACRNSLTDNGCCLNPYLHKLEQNFTACGLASPSACPRSSLTIPTSSDNSSCSSDEDFLRVFTEYSCSNGQPVLDDLISKNCLINAREIEDTCRYRDGKNCVVEIATSTMQEDAITNCPSTSSCSLACSSSLNGLKDSLGCCLNLFNASLVESSSDVSMYSVITDNALWRECGITPPGVCELLLNAIAPSAYTTSESESTESESTRNAAAPSAYTPAGNIAFLVLAASLFNFA